MSVSTTNQHTNEVAPAVPRRKSRLLALLPLRQPLRVQLSFQRRRPCCRELRPPGLPHGALRRKRRVVAVVCDGGVQHRGVRERLRELLHLGDGQAVQLDGVGLREVRGVGGGCRTLFSFW